MPQSAIDAYLERIPQLRSRQILGFVEAIDIALADKQHKKKMFSQLIDLAGFEKKREVPSIEKLALIGIGVEIIT